jgi:hypothetical protein
MNARIAPPLTLGEVTEHVEQWRAGKKKGERIPRQLWSEALALVGTHGLSQVSRTLRLSYTELSRRLKVVEAEQRRQGASTQTAFVEIDRALVGEASQPGAAPVWMELERPDGLRLRIRPTHGVDLLALVDRFMGVG